MINRRKQMYSSTYVNNYHHISLTSGLHLVNEPLTNNIKIKPRYNEAKNDFSN